MAWFKTDIAWITKATDFPSLIAAADSTMYREKTERKLGKLADPDRMHLGAEFGLPRAA